MLSHRDVVDLCSDDDDVDYCPPINGGACASSSSLALQDQQIRNSKSQHQESDSEPSQYVQYDTQELVLAYCAGDDDDDGTF